MAGNGIARVHEEQIPECKPPAIHQFSEPRRTAVKVGGGFVRDVAPQAACHGCLARAFRREALVPRAVVLVRLATDLKRVTDNSRDICHTKWASGRLGRVSVEAEKRSGRD
jgi:hypothetical protein